MRKLVFLSVLGLMAAASAMPAPSRGAVQAAEAWEIGPIIRGRNYSVGMPLKPRPIGRGWSFDFPFPNAGAGHVHYVTFNPGPILGATRIVARYRIDANRGVRFAPQETPGQPATVSLFLQRRDDNWSARRQYEYFRWYAPPATVREVAPGQYEISVSLEDPDWVSVLGKSAGSNPAAFRDALADTASVGLVFGSSGARGHGVYATEPARFTLIDFRIL